MKDTASSYHNLLEPTEYASLFLHYPPVDFQCGQTKLGLPFFKTEFDLLTTLEPHVYTKIQALPGASLWSKLLKLSACFCGTTITEYTPLPKGHSAASLLEDLKKDYANNQSLLIIKDLPASSPLLPEADNSFTSDFLSTATQNGFLNMEGQALAYVPIDFTDEAEYLSRLSPARRKDFRRKLRVRNQLEVEQLPLGAPLFFDQPFLSKAYAMYLEVFKQSDIHFDLLSQEYLTALLQSQTIAGTVFLYRHKGLLAGYNICLLHNNMLIDKYIGFTYPLARELSLYFVSWFVNLQYAKEQGCSHYVAGWTDPKVKASLGAHFTFTRHLVWIKNPILRRILTPLRSFFESDSKAIGKLP